jgi:hypothetical protein
MRIRSSTAGQTRDPRKGTVIITVLIVVVMLALAGYKYADLMSQEYHSAVSFVRAAKARALAWSGIHWGMAALSSSDNITNDLSGNPCYSPSTLQDHQIQGSDGATGYFTIASPGDPDNPTTDGSPTFGMVCEAGKINLNAVMKSDPTGNTLYQLLMQLPNMTDDIANSIVYWLDPTATTRSSGADGSYYSSLSPPYQAKNNYIDSLDELLLVRGVTPQLLFGADMNRNGLIDGNESDPNGFGAGWSTYLTIYSRELNVDSTGNPRTYVNDTLSNLYTNLQNLQNTVGLTQDMVNFIILYRTYGGTTSLPANATAQPASSYDVSSLVNQSSSSSSSSGSGSGGGASSGSQVSSLYDLINVYVTVPGKATTMTVSSNGKTTTVTQTPPPTYYASPLNDSSQLATLLPLVLDKLTTSKSQYYWGRININTTSQTVLNAVAAIGANSSSSASSSSSTSSTSGSGSGTMQSGLLQQSDVQNILANRPTIYTGANLDPSYQTPAWLIIKGVLKPATMKKIEKYITTQSQVFRVQSIGYQNSSGSFARLEAVIDGNGGQPRLMMWRDLTELGKGFNWQMNGQ